MAVRQNLCVQIGVCWLQRLIELAGKELVIFQIWFLVACAEVGGCSIDSPCVSQTHAESLCGCVQTEASKSYYAWDLRSLGKKSTLWSFCAVCLDATLSGRCHLWSGIFHHHHSHDHHHHHHDSFLRTIYFHGVIYHDISLKGIVMVDRLFREKLLQRVWPSCGLCSPGSDLCSCGMCSRIRSSRDALGCMGIAGGVFF